jgi:CubicO group peptidase (beta-lactamase class C family)
MRFRAGFRAPAAIAAVIALLSGPLAGPQFADTSPWPAWNAASQPHFPGARWQAYFEPEEAGWSSAGLARAADLAREAGSAAVFIVHDGAILARWGQSERRFMAHSIRKSLLSALYGIAVGEGTVDPGETIGAAGIDDIHPLTETEKRATIADLLKSRSGVYLPAAYETRSARESRPERGSHAPGTHWYYNNWDFNALATIYNRKTRSDLFEDFRRLIAQPIGMEDFALRHGHYHREPEASRHPAYRFRLSARDLARFGLLYLNGGRWNERQIVPAAWIRESTRAWSDIGGGGYGYMWWAEDGQLGELGAYAAWGYGGHAVYVVPGARLVFVHRADTFTGRHVRNGAVIDILKAVLQARTGPPRTDPKLVDLLPLPPQQSKAASVAPRIADWPLAAGELVTGALPGVFPAGGPQPKRTGANGDTLAALAGRYRGESGEAVIRVADGRLILDSPYRGRFLLMPRGGTDYLMEDIELPASFRPAGKRGTPELLLWFNEDAPDVLERVK